MWVIVLSRRESLMKYKDIAGFYNNIASVILITDGCRLVGSRNIFVRELIARTNLSTGRRQTTRQNSVSSKLLRASGRNVQSSYRIEKRVPDSRSYRDDALRTHLIPRRSCEKEELFISKLILEAELHRWDWLVRGTLIRIRAKERKNKKFYFGKIVIFYSE